MIEIIAYLMIGVSIGVAAMQAAGRHRRRSGRSLLRVWAAEQEARRRREAHVQEWAAAMALFDYRTARAVVDQDRMICELRIGPNPSKPLRVAHYDLYTGEFVAFVEWGEDEPGGYDADSAGPAEGQHADPDRDAETRHADG